MTISDKRQRKINNITEMIERNSTKIKKLQFVNSQLELQILKLREPVKQHVPTTQERVEQSERDKRKFLEEFKLSKSFQ